MAARDINTNFHLLSKVDLAPVLQRFYAEVRNKGGGLYCKSSMVNLRAGINRFLTSPPHCKQWDIMHDREFQDANQTFAGMLKKLRAEGKDTTAHKEAITQQDYQKLYSSGVFSTLNPTGLRNKVFFEICYHDCRRGREGLRDLRKDSFLVKKDEFGREFVTHSYHEKEKKKSGLSTKENEKEMRMYAQPDSPNCPVYSFKLYLEKLGLQSPAFFQQIATDWTGVSLWYNGRPIGKDPLGSWMSRLSTEAGLSKRYTNHCIRATAIQVMKASGIPDTDIMRKSGHKSADSLRSYVGDLDSNQQGAISDILFNRPEKTAGNPYKQASVEAGAPLAALPSTSMPTTQTPELTLPSNQELAISLNSCSHSASNTSAVQSLFSGPISGGQFQITFNMNQ